MRKYKYNHALITGGSSGIGLALSRILAENGSSVTIVARRKNQLESAIKEIESLRQDQGQNFTALQADVSNPLEIKRVLSDYMNTHGIPDILINCAGVTHPGNFEDIGTEIFQQMISINYLGTVYTIQTILPGMLQQRFGTIVNISSVAGFIGVYGYSAYSASKYAIRGFSDVLRAEMKSHGIQVSIVFPPDTQTPQLDYENKIKPAITKELAGNAGILSAASVAKTILDGTQKGKYIILPGFESKVIYRLNNLLGSLMYPIMDWLVRQAKSKVENKN